MAGIDEQGRINCGETTDELPALLIDSLEAFVMQGDLMTSIHRLDALRNLFYEWEDIAQDDEASLSWIDDHCRPEGALVIARLGESFLPISVGELAPNETDVLLPMECL